MVFTCDCLLSLNTKQCSNQMGEVAGVEPMRISLVPAPPTVLRAPGCCR
jgi:hypothetical protein